MSAKEKVVFWSFEADNGGGFYRSVQVFATRDEALKEATHWLEISAQNDFFPAVRVVKNENYA